MKQLPLLLLGAAFLAGCSASSPPDAPPSDAQLPLDASAPARPPVAAAGSKEFEAANHVFRATFGAPPRVQNQADGVMAIDRDHGMLITWNSLPRKATLNEKTVADIIKREEARSGVKFTSHKLTTFKTYPALVTHAALNKEQTFDTTYAVAGNNLYTVTLFHAPSTKGFAREQEAFLKSIELHPPVAGGSPGDEAKVERVKP